jgi:hypothetical protein
MERGNLCSDAKGDRKRLQPRGSEYQNERAQNERKESQGNERRENRAEDSKANQNKATEDKRLDQNRKTEERGNVNERDRTTTGQGAAPTKGVSVNITPEKRTRIHQVFIKERSAPRVDRVDFSLSVGTAVPRSVRFIPVPSTIVEIEPSWRGTLALYRRREGVALGRAEDRLRPHHPGDGCSPVTGRQGGRPWLPSRATSRHGPPFKHNS